MDPSLLADLRRLEQAVLSPDGTWLAVTVARRHEGKRDRYAQELWRVPLDPLDGAAPAQLTRGGFRDRAPAFRHDGSLLFLSNRPLEGSEPEEGSEQRSQVWSLPAAGGEPRPLTDEPLGVLAFRCAERAPVIVALAPVLPGIALEDMRAAHKERADNGPSLLRYTDMPVRHWDHWLPPEAPHVIVYDGEGGGRRDLSPSADREHRGADASDLALSPDGALLALTRRRQGPNREEDVGLFLLSLADGSERVVDETPWVRVGSPAFSPDGAHLAFLVVEGALERCGRLRLDVLTLADATRKELCPAWDRWPGPPVWSRDCRALFFAADDEGEVPVFAAGLDDDAPRRLTAKEHGGSHGSLCPLPDGGVAGLRHTVLHPPEVFRAGDDGAPRLLSRLSGLDPEAGAALAEVSSFVVEGDGGVPVRTHLVTPKGQGEAPALLWVHGGPINQFGDAWHWRWNPLTFVAQGYAVALPNARGSTGRGQAFIDGIWGNTWGEACYADLLAVDEALRKQPGVDEERVAVMGGSFGGYMTNWMAGNTGERFRCFLTHASVFHMAMFQATTDHPPYWARMMRAAPWSAELEKHSPHRFVDGWRRPTLVLHGEKDYRVPISEGLALFEALRARGVEAELVVFPDENHWILKPRNIIAWHEACFSFLRRHL